MSESMPLYTYRCTICGVQFNQQQKFTNKYKTESQNAAEENILKVFMPVGVVFRRIGFLRNRSPLAFRDDFHAIGRKNESGKHVTGEAPIDKMKALKSDVKPKKE